jgi:hypothetical protein
MLSFSLDPEAAAKRSRARSAAKRVGLGSHGAVGRATMEPKDIDWRRGLYRVWFVGSAGWLAFSVYWSQSWWNGSQWAAWNQGGFGYRIGTFASILLDATFWPSILFCLGWVIIWIAEGFRKDR